MTITIQSLQAHINNLDSGIIDFSQVELNTRADLVRFEGYSLERAITIDECEAYRIMEGDIYDEDEEWETNRYNLSCKCGSKDLKMKYVNGYPGRYSSDDGYLFKCNCGEEFFVHECVMDGMYKDEEEN
jgi:hypothetical protein